MTPTGHLRRRGSLAVALLLIGSLLVGACGGSENGGGDGGDGGAGDGQTDATPTPGGKVVYALEAETTDGYCLPEATLAISGMQVARTIYDTLTAPNEDGEFEPFLAESVEPNETYDSWTITLREGVKFHNGEDLTAEVVKNNLDAYRGQYPARRPLLFLVVFANIADVQVTGDMTVTVTTKTPWPALPASLFLGGRVGMMAQEQLDDTESCGSELIGTGPFELQEWVRGERLVATKFADYWDTDADGNPLPYLDEIEYRPINDGGTRVNALLAPSDPINMVHTASAQQMLELKAQDGLNVVSSDEYAEVSYGMMNTARAPFDSLTARKAIAYGIDLETFNEVVNEGAFENASGPFAPGSMGYVEDAGIPKYNLEEAKKLVAQYEREEGEKLAFSIHHTTDAEVTAAAQLLQQQAREVGVEVGLVPVDQAELIETVIGNEWQIAAFRNHPGGDPDTQYNWWHSTMPTNFGKFKDEVIDDLLDRGRQSADQEERAQIYQDINRRMGEQVYNYWLQWTVWTVGSTDDIFGVMGPDLPSGKGPFPGLATGHPVTGIWIQE